MDKLAEETKIPTKQECIDYAQSHSKSKLSEREKVFIRLIYNLLESKYEAYHEAKMKEELIKFSAWGFGSDITNKSIIDDVDEYLKQRNNDNN